MNLFEVERKLDEAIAALVPKGFKIIAGRYGDEIKGCAFKAFAIHVGDRRPGESPAQVACRHFNTTYPYILAAIAGYDGKGATSEVKAEMAGRSVGDHVAWYEMGSRLASKWKVHENSLIT